MTTIPLKFMSTQEVAHLLGLSPNTINQKAFSDKKFPKRHQIDGTYKKGFLRSEILAYKKKNEISENMVSRTQLRQRLEDMGLACSYSYIQVQGHYGQFPKGKRIHNKIYYTAAEADQIIDTRRKAARIRKELLNNKGAKKDV